MIVEQLTDSEHHVSIDIAWQRAHPFCLQLQNIAQRRTVYKKTTKARSQ
ncbi:hypothetical protein NKI89_25085 [Mesorhizobium sp. M0309]